MSDLPKKNIDTGAGMERILALMAGSPSLYAADVLSVLVDEAQRVTGHRLGESEITDVALRLMADHTRTMTFLVSDGVIPSNEDRGYVLRRIIRRAIRFAYVTGVERLVLGEMIDRCIGVMSDAYPELIGNRDLILSTIEREEAKFRQTLKTGSSLLDSELSALPAGGRLDGEVAFKLHDTYGFPLEVTQEFTELGGYELDVAGFEAAMANQRANSKAGAKATGVATDAEAGEFRTILDEHGQTTFVGREVDESPARVIATVGNTVVLDVTPFYAESGGQIGDTGSISWDGTTLHVIDTTSALPAGASRHRRRRRRRLAGLARARSSPPRSMPIGARHPAPPHRHPHPPLGAAQCARHARQAAGVVGRSRSSAIRLQPLRRPDARPDRRDRGSRQPRDPDQRPVSHEEMTKDEAMKLGAIAFFGDKYGDTVRVLQAGPNSIEFCGGTHVQRGLGDIGPLKIVSETSIGSNIRRLEAIAGLEPIKLIRSEERTLSEVAATLGVPVGDIAEGLRKRLDENKAQKAEIAALRRQVAQASAGDLVDAAVDGVLVARIESETRDEVRRPAVCPRRPE